ncbi:MAG: magnesium chelatase [Firmicutes bacterium HGW-Firmicutes-1]|nr:MAG: magnesium chelatase [Firmicutes bacterium HGW-Firmicutes-1]
MEDVREMDIQNVKKIYDEVRNEVKKVIIEQDKMIEYAIISFFCGGHILIEGVPGLGKTLFIKALTDSMNMSSNRIQFTPDMMPADVVGTKIYNMQSQTFELRKGPIFANLILADEINRTPPKTQAGLLEAMQEESVSIDGVTMELPQPFMVMATQNPIEFEGTYSLPEALIDRFLFKIQIDYPSLGGEVELLKRMNDIHTRKLDSKNCGVQSVCREADILAVRNTISEIKLETSLYNYIVEIVRATRNHKVIEIGSSPRGGIAIMNAAKAYAAIQGREFVLPEDIKEVAIPALNHRIILIPEAELEGIRVQNVLTEILNTVKVPR